MEKRKFDTDRLAVARNFGILLFAVQSEIVGKKQTNECGWPCSYGAATLEEI